MRLHSETFDAVATCLEYPRGPVADHAASVVAKLGGRGGGYAPVSQAMTELIAWLADAEVGGPEERYTQLFDLKPVCTMNTGYHLFGDTYQRGELLAGLSADLTRYDVAFGHDLPDFLPTLLRLLGRLEDDEDRRVLVHAIVMPALVKMNDALEKSPGPWPTLLAALPAFLDEEIPKGDDQIPVPRRPLEVLQCSM